MQLNQIFYGNAGFGYKVLGASDASLSGKAAEICRAVGTPDGISELAPFLLSVPDGEQLFMVCCSPGKADGVGRKTLFFHVLVGNRDEATSAGINAFSLWESKRFSDALPSGSILPISVLKLFGESDVPAWNGVLLRIPRKRPANSEIRQLVGSRVNDVAWATFSFCNLDVPFELYAVSEHVPLPAEKPTPPPRPDETNATPPPAKEKKPGVLKTAVCIGLFTASVLLNVLLLTKKEEPQERQTDSVENGEPITKKDNPTKEEIPDIESRLKKERNEGFAEGERKGYQKAFADLREKFPKESVVSSDQVGSKELYDYVIFVNDNILKLSVKGE